MNWSLRLDDFMSFDTTALGVSLASLFEQAEDSASIELSPHSSLHDQPRWTDPGSGYVRRNLSPPVWSPIQLVEVEFPARKTGCLRDGDP